ncbi:MAG TPA: HNH endonuclease signature motif containing protein [Bellilinea sp.]|nr:HNH endonuclease signature motif containing protein [Bellilinea sp.]
MTPKQGDSDTQLPHTRAEAKAIGSKHYFTGDACKHGHVAKRRTSNGRCDVCETLQRLEWMRRNPDAKKTIGRRYRENNPDKIRAKNERWVQNNPGRMAGYKRRYLMRPKDRIENSMRVGMHRGLTKGAKAGRRTFAILGYSVEELQRHLESHFQPGMSWSNYGKGGWEIDHIIPLSAHNYETPDDIDFKRAWALSNLKPLWASDNRKKHAKLSDGFQPSLALADAANDNKQNQENQQA